MVAARRGRRGTLRRNGRAVPLRRRPMRGTRAWAVPSHALHTHHAILAHHHALMPISPAWPRALEPSPIGRKCASLATSSSTLCAKPERGMHHAFTPQLVRARGAGERRTCPLAPIGATSSPHRGCMLGDRDPRDKSYLVQENQTGEQTSHVRARAPLARAAAGRSAHRSGDGSPYSLLEVRCTAGGRAPASDRSLLKHCFQTPSASATLYRL